MFGMELMDCQGLAVPREVMQHVVRVESSFNPFAIGVVGGRLARQPRNLSEAVATARMLERRGYNFSLGLAQVNRYNLAKQGLATYEQAFQACPNLQAGSRILAECHGRSGGSWGRAFSCYYSGNFTTGYRHGYVQKVFASMGQAAPARADESLAIEVIGPGPRRATRPAAVSSPRRAAAATPDAAARRVAARVVPLRAASVQATAPAPDPPVASTPSATVAVLDASGGPPRLLQAGEAMPSDASRAAPAAAPAVSTTASRPDAAFVF